MAEIKPIPTQSLPPAKPDLFSQVKKYLTRGGSALRHRNFRLFWTGQAISLIGTWMQNLAQAWLVLTLSNGDPLALGTVTALQFMPLLLFSLFTGVVADRFPKRTILLITQSASMTQAVLLAVLTTFGWVQIWQIYIVAFWLGLANAFDVPARQTLASEMVPREDLMNAVALNSTTFNLARALGPALAGLIIGIAERLTNSTQAGVAFAVWLNALSYLAVIYSLLRIKATELYSHNKPRSTGPVLKNLKEGISFIWHSPDILTTIVVVGMLGTFGFNFNVWIPVLSRHYLNVGAEGYGVLMAGLGVGALASAIGLAIFGKQPDRKRILISLVFFGLLETGVAFSPWFISSLICMAGTGFAMIQVTAASNTYIQMNSPDNLRGRVMSVYVLVFAGTTPLGSLLVGWVSSGWGTPVSMLVGAMLSVSAAPLVLIGARVRRHKIENPISKI